MSERLPINFIHSTTNHDLTDATSSEFAEHLRLLVIFVIETWFSDSVHDVWYLFEDLEAERGAVRIFRYFVLATLQLSLVQMIATIKMYDHAQV